MPVVNRYDVGPELLGNWVAESSARDQTRENVNEGRKYALNVAELNQRGSIAAAQLTQDAISRDQNAAMRMTELGARIGENRFEAQQRMELEKLQGQQQDARLDKMQQNQYDEIEMRAAVEEAARNRSKITVPDFNDGAIQNHELAIANQKLAGQIGQVFEQELIAKIAGGDPEAIKQGLGVGLLRFTDDQKKEAVELQNALSKLSDPKLDPRDRAKGQAMLTARLQAIQPQLVPEDERMPDINTEVSKRIAVWTNPINEKQYNVTLDRNGEPRVLDLNEEKPTVEKPATIRERLQVDPGFQSTMLGTAYKRVMDRKQAEWETANSARVAQGLPAEPFVPPNVAEQRAELEQMLQVAESPLSGSNVTSQQPPTAAGAMPPTPGAPPVPQPPPGVAQAVQAFGAANGLPAAPAGSAAPAGQTRLGQPAAKPKPREGLTDELAKSIAARVQKYRQQAAKQGGKLDANDYAHYAALCEDLGITP